MKGKSSFSLVELLAVMAVIGIVAALSIPAFTSIMTSSNLTNGGELMVSQISLARQEAVTKNQQVEVLFYQLPRGSSTTWCGIQIFGIATSDSGTSTNAITRLTLLPDGVMISADKTLSSLISYPPISGNTTVPNHGIVPSCGFIFRPNGDTDYSVTATNNILTVENVNGGTTPKNYFTLQVNPIGGKISIFRP